MNATRRRRKRHWYTRMGWRQNIKWVKATIEEVLGLPEGYYVRLDTEFLESVKSLGGDAYGMRIRQDVSERVGRNVSIGLIYRVGDGLENQGILRSWTEPGGTERGGRDKKFWEVVNA